MQYTRDGVGGNTRSFRVWVSMGHDYGVCGIYLFVYCAASAAVSNALTLPLGKNDFSVCTNVFPTDFDCVVSSSEEEDPHAPPPGLYQSQSVSQDNGQAIREDVKR